MKNITHLWIVAVVLGLGTVVALNFYLRDLRQTVDFEDIKINVVVAARTIPAHTRITSDMIEVVSLPVESIHPHAYRKTEDVSGGISRSEIILGEQVLTGRVITGQERGTLSYRIPDNMRAIAIPVNEVTGVGGYISPGDYVDVLVTYRKDSEVTDETVTYTVFQNISVLAVGDNPAEEDSAESNVVGTVTIAVTPEQAEVLAYAFLTGSFHLTLRLPTDHHIVDLEFYGPSNFDTYGER